jgi:hypothetical protein
MVNRDRGLQLRDRFVVAPQLRQRAPRQNLRVDVLLVALERLHGADERLVEPSRRQQQPAGLDARVAILGVEIDGVAVGAVRLFRFALFGVGVAQLRVRRCPCGLLFNGVPVLDHRGVVPARCGVPVAGFDEAFGRLFAARAGRE